MPAGVAFFCPQAKESKAKRLTQGWISRLYCISFCDYCDAFTSFSVFSTWPPALYSFTI
jgi:hypothetical protein